MLLKTKRKGTKQHKETHKLRITLEKMKQYERPLYKNTLAFYTQADRGNVKELSTHWKTSNTRYTSNVYVTTQMIKNTAAE